MWRVFHNFDYFKVSYLFVRTGDMFYHQNNSEQFNGQRKFKIITLIYHELVTCMAFPVRNTAWSQSSIKCWSVALSVPGLYNSCSVQTNYYKWALAKSFLFLLTSALFEAILSFPYIQILFEILCSGLKGRRPFWLLNPRLGGGGGVLACCCLRFPFLEMRRWSRRRWL